jgi:hypothetical protein
VCDDSLLLKGLRLFAKLLIHRRPARSRQVGLMLNAFVCSLKQKKLLTSLLCLFQRQNIKGAHTKDQRNSVIALKDGLFFFVAGIIIIIVCLSFPQSAADGDTSKHARRGQQAALDAERR